MANIFTLDVCQYESLLEIICSFLSRFQLQLRSEMMQLSLSALTMSHGLN